MKRFLIEEGLPFAAVNAASTREKSGGGPDHPRRLHLWWARRPLAMSRAIVLGSVLPDPGPRERAAAFAALERAVDIKDTKSSARIDALRDLVQHAYPDDPPRVLDVFAGGGAIPLEALRLGCAVTAIDLNPVAHLIERCMLEYPQHYPERNSDGTLVLARDVHQWGEWVEQRASEAVRSLYLSKEGDTPLVWFWARTMPCPNHRCGVEMPLVTSWWLLNTRRQIWLDPVLREKQIELTLCDRQGESPKTAPVMRASSATCPACGNTASARDVRAWARANRFGLRLLAVLDDRDGERAFRLAQAEDEELAAKASEWIDGLPDLDEDGMSVIPDEQLDPSQYRKFGMLPFGMTTYRELFTPRQLAAAASLTRAVRESFPAMVENGMPEDRAKAVTTYLSLLISRVVDWNSAFSSWRVTVGSPRSTFARQSLAMVWDFTEINPFADIAGNWGDGLNALVGAIESCARTGTTAARVIRGNAQCLDAIPDATFDAVVTDPPYYDAVQYADLSDYFYVWLKRAIGDLYPDLFAAPLTPKAQEVIENRADKKAAAYISSAEFEKRLARSIAEMRRVVKPDGVVTIVFAHTDSDAWERLLRGLMQAGLVVSASWPMESEAAGRSTANLSAVLGSSVVLACRPRVGAEIAFYDDVIRELDARIGERLDEFERLGLAGADFLISAIGPAFEVFGKYTSVQRLNGEEVGVGELLALARRTVASHAMRRLLGSEGLAAVDDVSLFYLTWRWAYGSARIPVDEAQKLGKAFNVDAAELHGVDGLVDTARDTYGLRGPDERKRIKLAATPSLVDVLHLSCKLFEDGQRGNLAEVLSATGFAEEPAFWAAARAIAESLPDGDRERTLLVNLLGGQALAVEAARQALPSEAMRLFEVEA